MTDPNRRGLPQPVPTPEQARWLDRVDKIAPLIEEHRDDGDRDRVTSREVFEALSEAGLTRMWVSRHFGGEQVAVDTGMAVLEALGRLDASVAWQIGVQGAIGRLSDYLPEQTSRELFKDGDGFVVGGVKPSGFAEPVDGGYLVRGEWAMASGSAHADWLLCTSLVTRDGKPVPSPTGPDLAMAFVPVAKTEKRDTWYTLGLRGTGSNHFRVAETFVPEAYVVKKSQMQLAPPDRASRAYALSYFDFGPLSTAPVALGVAREALDAFVRMAAGKVPASGTVALADNPVVQDHLARAETRVHAARLMLFDAARLAVEHGTGDDSLSALIRLASASVGESTVAAVDSVFTLAGSSSVYSASRLERCFRDVHSVTKHLALSHSHFETVGQYLLGGDLLVRK